MRIKKMILPALCMLVAAVATAQPKSKTIEKNKLGEYDNIVIKWKGDTKGEKGEKGDKGDKGDKGSKNIRLNIEIKNDLVTINGKPLDEFESQDLAVIKRNNLVFDGKDGRIVIGRGARSPFQSGQALSFSGPGNFNFDNGGENAYLGVASEKTNGGVVITEVTRGSAAEKAGLKNGDIITKIDDKTIGSPAELSTTIKSHKPDEKITVTYKRSDKEARATATLGKTGGLYQSFNFDMPEWRSPDNFNFTWGNDQPKIGIRAQDTDDAKGVKVIDVDEGSIAEKAGIKEDDIITSLDGTAVNSVNELLEVSKAARDAKKISMPVKFTREGKEMTADLKVPRKLKTAEL